MTDIVWPEYPDYVTDVEAVHKEWQEVVAAYEANPTLHNASLYLTHHPAFWRLPEDTPPRFPTPQMGFAWCFSIEFGIEWDDTVWVEVTPHGWSADEAEREEQYKFIVDHRTFEEAVRLVASIIHDDWGNDREFLRLGKRWFG